MDESRDRSVAAPGARARASRYEFTPEAHERELTSIIGELLGRPAPGPLELARLLKRHPKNGRELFSKSELIRAYRHLGARLGWRERDPDFVEKLKAKPVRTGSGVTPVTVLTKPFPCPGECIFCPNDVRMPKSYLAMEPGAQRAAQHAFDPYGQVTTRLRAFENNGHGTDKIELIVLGGTWSFYPEAYQRWFVKRCFDAMNDFRVPERRTPSQSATGDAAPPTPTPAPVWPPPEPGNTPWGAQPPYNQAVSRRLRIANEGELLGSVEHATWAELEGAHAENEGSACRCVGLSVETRPDHVSPAEALRLRRLGATKVQLGYQSLSDEVLRLNRRGHGVEETRAAMRRLRLAGFKVHAHWMPNLYGSDPAGDIADFVRIFTDPALRPDELKIYPCSLIESAELMVAYREGRWRPYTEAELLEVLVSCLATVPRWCRLTRIIRDIPSHDIVVGNKQSNLRELATAEAARRGIASADVRAREIRGRAFDPDRLALVETAYATSVGEELFLELVTPGDELVAFLRLSLPVEAPLTAELRGAAMIREVHVYGVALGIGERSPGRAQHAGLGRRLLDRAAEIARSRGFERLAVISAVGTRRYYASAGFERGALYQHRALR